MSDYWDTYTQAKQFYYEIKEAKCFVLGRSVIFDDRGFRHIIKKKKSKRPISDQIRRFKLLFHVLPILNRTDLTISHELRGHNKYVILSSDGKPIDKIVLLERHGRIYFISIQ